MVRSTTTTIANWSWNSVNYIIVLDIIIWRNATTTKKGQELQASELVLSINTT
jgi:hypothetical protein